MNDSWSTPIDKLMYWCGRNWTKYENKSGNLLLRMYCDQLLISTDSKVLECLNMHTKIKGIFKEDILILIISNLKQEVRKVKFQIKCNVAYCLQKLGEHFPVVNYHSSQSGNIPALKYRRLEYVLKHAMERKEDSATLSLPSEYANFVKLCLMDPTFPQVVRDTEKIIVEEIMKK